MPPITIHSSPSLDTFTPLSDHQSHTPSTFFGAKPVLHYHLPSARILIQRDQASKLPIFITENVPSVANGARNGDSAHESDSVLGVVDVFAASSNLTLFFPTSSIGLQIPYPNITLHAIQRLSDPSSTIPIPIQGLYMQLELSDPSFGDEEDDGPEIVEVTLLPPSASSSSTPTLLGQDQATTTQASPIQDLFSAVSSCSNLHPDPGASSNSNSDADGDEQMSDSFISHPTTDSRIIFESSLSSLPGVTPGVSDGGLPPPFPGSGGWITAENVGEFFDENGNWIGPGSGVGEGDGDEEEGMVVAEEEPMVLVSGRVRGRSEVDREDVSHLLQGEVNGNGNGGVNGFTHGRAEEETKRLRTE